MTRAKSSAAMRLVATATSSSPWTTTSSPKPSRTWACTFHWWKCRESRKKFADFKNRLLTCATRARLSDLKEGLHLVGQRRSAQAGNRAEPATGPGLSPHALGHFPLPHFLQGLLAPNASDP